MNLPCFNADAALYASTARYSVHRPRSTPGSSPSVLAAADHFQDFCNGRELDANYAHPDTCEKYISCDLSGRAQEMPCVAGLHFMADETRWGHCDYPHVAKCDTD